MRSLAFYNSAYASTWTHTYAHSFTLTHSYSMDGWFCFKNIHNKLFFEPLLLCMQLFEKICYKYLIYLLFILVLCYCYWFCTVKRNSHKHFFPQRLRRYTGTRTTSPNGICFGTNRSVTADREVKKKTIPYLRRVKENKKSVWPEVWEPYNV